MIAAVTLPLRALSFALGGAILAYLWFRVGAWLPLVVLAVAVLGGWVLSLLGKSRLPDHPIAALRWFEWRALSIGVIAAVAAGIAIVVGVEITVASAPEGEDAVVAAQAEQLKAVVAAVSAALAALVTGLATKPEDLDSAVGAYVKDAFAAAYDVRREPGAAGQARPVFASAGAWRSDGKILFPSGSDALDAVGSTYAWPDWLKENRTARAEAIAQYLAENPPRND